MTQRTLWRSALVSCALALCAPVAHADEDRPVDRDWVTGVTLAPGAQTWTADHFDNKKDLIRRTAEARGKTCADGYAAVVWAPTSGGVDPIKKATQGNYSAAGFTIAEKLGEIETERIWTVTNAQDGRQAVILWGDFQGSTIYLSCLTTGSAATVSGKPIYLGALLLLGLGLLGAGAWLIWRERALGAASRTWPTASGTIKSSHVAPYDADGIEKYVAKVTYDYTVRGKTYAGDCLRFGAYAGAQQKAQQDVDKYRVGARVEVRYAPRQPQTSTLEPGIAGVNAGGVAIAAGGAALLGLAVVIAILV